MKKKFPLLLCFLAHLFVSAQKDSIFIKAYWENNRLNIKQRIVYYNKSTRNLHQIKLINFVSAYKNRNTSLLDRKLEDRKTDLYYAKENQLGKLITLLVNGQAYSDDFDKENIFIDVPTLMPNDSAQLNLEYSVQIPDAQFTGYGVSKNDVLLKYFFLVPDYFDTENAQKKHYFNIDETINVDTFYAVDFSSSPMKVSSNLPEKSPKIFEGKLNKDVEVYLSSEENFKIATFLDGKNYLVEFAYPLSEEEKNYLEFYLPLQLKFIKEKISYLPEKIFISKKSKLKNDFLGNDDIKFWKFNFKLFTNAENIDLDYISIVSQEVADQIFVADKNKTHWLTNGLKTYLEIQYLEKFYSQHKLLGNLPNYKIFGIRPLKYSYISELKLTDRYSLPHQYIMAQNFDQKIDENLRYLSNFNEFAVSKFETGSILNFIAEKMGVHYFDDFLKNYLSNYKNTTIDTKDFLNQMAICSGYSSEFLEEYIQHKNRINFKLKSFKNIDNNIHIKVSKNTSLNIPFKLETLNESGVKSTYWYDTNNKHDTNTYVIPNDNIKKIIINDQFAFPESNYRDNYLYTKGLFSNSKKIKFKFFSEIPNPEYNEIYVAPKLFWNNYDKFLLGAKFQNKSLIDRPFLYSITPFYSTGTNSLTGSITALYKIQPAESFFRNINLGVMSSYFHYNYNLAYTKLSLSASMLLNKNPRSQISRSIVTSYNFFQRDLSPQMIAEKDYKKYNIWNAGFIYSESGIIKDKYLFGNLQLMEDYQKISAESYYRWEYAKNKKLSLRFFGGAFINNKTRNNTFDFGISKVSNYAFSYDLLAQSASSGILSQQFVIAEGGFKSLINKTANQYILSTNLDFHAWKMFNIYADMGVYKNKYEPAEFIWDSGIKLKVIPDFLEIYFPIQSSLGFEPGFKDYKSRIRYTLSLNLNSVIGHFRKGWY